MSTGPKTVTLTDPDGNDVLVSQPSDITNLVYGLGYKVKGNQTADQAYAALAVNPPVEVAVVVPEVPSAPVADSKKA